MITTYHYRTEAMEKIAAPCYTRRMRMSARQLNKRSAHAVGGMLGQWSRRGANSRFAAANFSPAQRHRKNLIDSRLKERFDSWVTIQKTYVFIQVANVASGPTWHFHNESRVQTLTRVFSDSSDFFCSLPVANSLALMWIWRASAKERMEHNTSKSKAQKPLDWAQTDCCFEISLSWSLQAPG